VAPWEVASEVRSGLSGAAAPIEAIFAVGERVSYWSDTHKQWMEAVVTKQNLHPHGAVMSYDLDVKRGARPDKMRRMTHINEAASASGNSASGPVTVHVTSGTDIVQPHPPHVAKDSQVPSAMTPARFEIGDRVEYWSETYSQWMQAIVQKVRDDGITYDLDVKRGAQRKKMRASQGLAESSAPAPNSVPQTCAAGLQAVPAEPRGPSHCQAEFVVLVMERNERTQMLGLSSLRLRVLACPHWQPRVHRLQWCLQQPQRAMAIQSLRPLRFRAMLKGLLRSPNFGRIRQM
jgi:hypothetical protein